MQMKPPKLGFSMVLLTAALATSISLTKPSTGSADKSEVERGRYLVEEVANAANVTRLGMRGANWIMRLGCRGHRFGSCPCNQSQIGRSMPRLAGLPSFTEEEVERVLEKGTGPEGETLRPPMHIYHMSHADSKAIIAYLKSLRVALH
jgi:hypothetical protein